VKVCVEFGVGWGAAGSAFHAGPISFVSVLSP
jgi:hypothetical protein